MKTFDRSYAEIHYHELFHAVEVQWKGFATVEQYKEIMESALNVVIAKHCIYWISDMVHGKAVPAEASEWLQKDFIPRVLNRGIKKVAFLIDQNALRAMYARSIKGAIETNNIPLRYFSSRKELEEWFNYDTVAVAPQTTYKAAVPYHYLLAEV